MTECNERQRLVEELRKFAEISGEHLYCHDPWNKSNPIRIACQAALAEINELRERCRVGFDAGVDQLRLLATIADQAKEIERLREVCIHRDIEIENLKLDNTRLRGRSQFGVG